MNKLLKISILTLSLTSFLNIESKRYWFNTDFFEDLHQMHEIVKHDMQELENYFHKYEINDKVKSEEDQKAKEAVEKLEKITPEIKKDENGDIQIIFALKDINKNSIEDIALQDNMLVGHLDLENELGKINFYITDHNLKLARKLEFKDKENKNLKYVYNYSSSNVYSLPLSVELSNASAELKDDNLIINLKPKSYSKIKIKK